MGLLWSQKSSGKIIVNDLQLYKNDIQIASNFPFIWTFVTGMKEAFWGRISAKNIPERGKVGQRQLLQD